jgi:hypothetical protein
MADILCSLIIPASPRVDYFSAPVPIERVVVLPVQNYGPSPLPAFPVRHRFAQVYLPGCLEGDLIEAEFDAQVSNVLGYQVEVAWSLRLTKERAGFEGPDFKTLEGTSNATNVTWAQHHCAIEENGSIIIPSAGNWFVIAMLYAGGGSQSQAGDQILADQGYGSFSAKRIRA